MRKGVLAYKIIFVFDPCILYIMPPFTPLKSDAKVTLSYKKVYITCVVKWSYDFTKIVSYYTTITRDEGILVDFIRETLKKPSNKGSWP